MPSVYSEPPNRAVERSFYATPATFAASCFVLAFLGDLATWATASYLWETVSVWLLAIGLIGAVLAVVAGLVDLVRSRRARGLAQPWPRLLGHVVAVALATINVFVHRRDGYTAVVPQGLLLSALTVLVLLAATIATGRVTTRHATAGGLA